MPVLTILMIWWTLSSVTICFFFRMPYDVFVEDKFPSTVIGIILGPVIWCLLIVYWIVFIKDMIVYSFKRQ